MENKQKKEIIKIIISEIRKDRLELSFNRRGKLTFNEIPDELWGLDEIKNLRKLSIGSLKLENGMESICNLINLEELIINCELNYIPKDICKLQKLRMLGIGSSGLEIIPEEFTELTELKKLTIFTGYRGFNDYKNHKNVKLRMLPNSFGNLTKLEELTLYTSNIEELPETIGNCFNLSRLVIDSDCLIKLPDTFCNLINITNLKLSAKKLTSLPNDFGKLLKLVDIEISDSALTTLPKSIGNCSALKKLDIHGNQINFLPDEIGNLENLENFLLHQNNLKELPDSIGKLNNLIFLNLSSNKLEQIPNTINKLSKLQKLKLSNNKIHSLPHNLDGLDSLQSLMLLNNNLSSLPASFVKLKSLINCSKNKNPFDEMPEVLELKGLIDVTRFLSEYYNLNINSFTVNLEKEWQIPIQQYLMFFKEYFEKTEGKAVDYQVHIVESGLEIIISEQDNLTSSEVGLKILEYVNLLKTNLNEWIITDYSGHLTAFEADILTEELKENQEAFWHRMKFQKMKREGDIRKLEMKLRDERTDKAALKDELVILKSKCTVLENDIENRDNVITRLENEIGRVYSQVERKDNQIDGLIGNQANSLALPQNLIMQQNSEGTKKPLKIFLASSNELKAERDAFELHFGARKRKTFAYDLEVVRWEDFIDAMSADGLQAEYNKAIVEGCDIFVMLFFSKVGKYTEEEFEKAFGAFKENGKPLIYTYFKNSSINMGDIDEDDFASLLAFKKKLKTLGHYFTQYKDATDLNFHFNNQLDKLLNEGKI